MEIFNTLVSNQIKKKLFLDGILFSELCQLSSNKEKLIEEIYNNWRNGKLLVYRNWDGLLEQPQKITYSNSSCLLPEDRIKIEISSVKKNWKIATWNVNSIRTRLPLILNWLKLHNPDTVCLQETKVEDKLFPTWELQQIGYESTFHGQSYYISSGKNITSVSNDYEDSKTIFTKESHGLSENSPVRLSTTGRLPTGFNNSTNYFAVSVKKDTFKLSTSSSGTAIEYTDKGTGTHSFGKKISSSMNGVAILSKHPIKDVQKGFLNGYDKENARIIKATVSGVRVINVYVPQGQTTESEKFQYKLDFFSELIQEISQEKKLGGALTIMGDFNVAPEAIDLSNPESMKNKVSFHPKEHEYLTKIKNCGLIDVFRKFDQNSGKFSWWDFRTRGFERGEGMRIDYILGNSVLTSSCQACIIDIETRAQEHPSDHAPVIAEFIF